MNDERIDPLLRDEQEERQLIVAVQLSNDGALTAEQRKAVVSAVESHMVRYGLTQKHVRKACKGIGAGTLTDLLNLKYRASTADDHYRTLNNWIEQDARRRIATLGKKPITHTIVVEKIKGAADICRAEGKMGVVMGPTGIGKTTTAEQLAATLVGCIYIDIDSSNRNAQPLLAELADRLKVGRSNKRKDLARKSLFKRVVEELSETHRLIILDDADKLRDPAIELLREINDKTRAPMLFIGVVDFWRRILNVTDQDRGQLKRRFMVRIDLRKVTAGKDSPRGKRKEPVPLFTRAEIAEICSPPKVRLIGGAVDYLHKVANELGEGSLARCLDLVSMAARSARKRQGVEPGNTVSISSKDLYNVQRLTDMTYDDDIADEAMDVAKAAMAASA